MMPLPAALERGGEQSSVPAGQGIAGAADGVVVPEFPPPRAAPSGSPPTPVPAATSPEPAPGAIQPPPPSWGDLPEGRPVGGSVEELLDPRRNGRAMVVTAAGVLLAFVGLRTIFGARREPRLARRAAAGYEFD